MTPVTAIKVAGDAIPIVCAFGAVDAVASAERITVTHGQVQHVVTVPIFNYKARQDGDSEGKSAFFFVVGVFLLRVRGAFFFAAGARRVFFLLWVRGVLFFAARVCGAVCRALFFAAGMHAACFLLLRVRGAFFFLLRVRGAFFFCCGCAARFFFAAGARRVFFCCECAARFFFFFCGCAARFFFCCGCAARFLLRVRIEPPKPLN